MNEHGEAHGERLRAGIGEELGEDPRGVFLSVGLSMCLSVFLSVVPVQAQDRPPVSANVQRFITVDYPVLALTHVRVVDGTGTPARNDQTIVVTGSLITAVGPHGVVTIPDGAHVLDLNGHTVIPGIVGLHEHTYFGGVPKLTQMSTAPLLYLAMGVTTAMTAGSQLPYQELNQKRMVDAGTLPGPRFEIAGPYVDGGPARASFARIIETPDDARRVVDYWGTEGATWIKVMGLISRDLMAAVIEAAHVRGMKVTGHICSVTFTEAAQLGIDALQHGFITNSDYIAGKQPDRCPPNNMVAQANVDMASPAVARSIRNIVTAGAAVVSTLGVYETFAPSRPPLDPRMMEFLDADTRREVEANHASSTRNGFVVPDSLLLKMMQWERAFVAAGGVLGAGSDPWGSGYLPGFGNLRNFEKLVEAGFTAEQAIRILTLNGAVILGEADRIGSIGLGKLADLVVIRGDPVRMPSTIYEVVTVFKDGRGYDSARLRVAARGGIGR